MTKISVKKALFVLTVLIISFVNVSYAVNFEEQKIFKEGKKHFKKERYHLALPHFLSLQQAYPDNSNWNYCVGMCYYYTSSMYDSCIYYLTRSTATKNVTLYYKNTATSDKAPAKAYYYLGIAYFRNNMPETAIRHFKHYQRFLDLEIKEQRFAYDDLNLQIQRCEDEKGYADQQRSLKTAGRDSLLNEIAFYKTNYEGTAQLLETKTNEIIHLLQELNTYNKSRNMPIGTPVEAIPEKITSFTVQVLTSEKDSPVSDFSNIPNLKKYRMADGLYHYLSGDFATREEADTRCKEIRNLGYPDAWVRPTFGN
ncbi:MAG: SPOR domain-containing protein [Bacteroidales bacterium]|nr:SPOR domain-containing protein [Bacteroidales bacterium]